MKINSTFHMDEVKGFQANLIKQLCERSGVETETIEPHEILEGTQGVFVHDPNEFQHQLFFTGDINYPHRDEEDFFLDKLLAYGFSNEYLKRPGRSEAEISINNMLYENPLHSIHVSPLGDNNKEDLTDKMNAQQILPNIGIPVPKEYDITDYSGKRLFVKPKKGSKCEELEVVEKQDLKKRWDLEDCVVQEEVKIPTEDMSYVRITMDFGEMTSAGIIYAHTDKPESKNIGRILLNCHGFEHKQSLTEEEKKFLNAYGGRKIPEELIQYTNKIFDYTKRRGLHSIGVDYIFDMESNKWLCTGDINKAPGRQIYLELEKARGNRLKNNDRNRAYAAAKYVSGPFKNYLHRL